MFHAIPIQVILYECWKYTELFKQPYVPKKCVNFTRLRKMLQKHIYHHRIKNNDCAIMITSNPAEPKWIYVNCHIPILSNVMCVRKSVQENDLKYFSQSIAKKYCSSSQILIHGKCFLFIWYTFIKYHSFTMTKVCQVHDGIWISEAWIGVFEGLFDAISEVFPPILMRNYGNNKYMRQISYVRHIDWYNYTEDIIQLDSAKGYIICEDKKGLNEDKNNTFMCIYGGYISYLYICDGKQDCLFDDSDENNVYCQQQKASNDYSNHMAASLQEYCGPLFYRDKVGTCQKYYPQNTIENHINCKMENYGNGKDIHEHGFNSNDDQILIKKLLIDNHLLCGYKNKWSCMEGDANCFAITDICSYTLNECGHLIPCRNGQHLQSCRKFQCNLRFKCLNSYCIPISYLCNNRWDCPNGEDESIKLTCESRRRCVGMYLCHNRFLTCTNLHNVCDGNKECPEGDDEYHCEIKNTFCPSNCLCLLFAIYCSSGNFPVDTEIYMSILLSDIVIQDFEYFIKSSANLVHLKIHNSGITDTCFLIFPARLHILDLGMNSIVLVRRFCFKDVQILSVLLLNQNLIRYLYPYSFINTQSLKHLSLSNNPLTNFPSQLFYYSQFLKILSLRKITMQNIDPYAFVNLYVAHIDTDDYHFCCLLPQNSTCTLKMPWFVSCFDLLPDTKSKIAFMVIPFLIICLNILSIGIHINKSQGAFGTIVTSLNINYIFFAVYFKIIWISNEYFLGVFVVKEKNWRSSIFCFMAFLIYLWHTFLTQLLLIYLSLSRLFIIIKPLSTHFKYNSIVKRGLTLMFFISFVMCLITTLYVKETSEMLPYSFCHPFVDTTKSIMSIQFLTWITVLTQTITFVFILISHLCLVSYVMHSKKKFKKLKSRLKTSLITQILSIAIFNSVYWFSLNCIYIAMMYLKNYPVDLIIWSTTAISPLNAIFHPLLFFTVSLKKAISTRGKKISTDMN